MGLGATICETDSGRPLGISRARELRFDDLCLSRDDEDEEDWCLEELWEDLDDDLLDLSLGTSRMLSSRPVVGSTVEGSLGLCETW